LSIHINEKEIDFRFVLAHYGDTSGRFYCYRAIYRQGMAIVVPIPVGGGGVIACSVAIETVFHTAS
jgi:predicted aldo/keto reductase-like oxidoreductase